MLKSIQFYSPFNTTITEWWYGKHTSEKQEDANLLIEQSTITYGALHNIEKLEDENLLNDNNVNKEGLLNENHRINEQVRSIILEDVRFTCELNESSDGFHTPDNNVDCSGNEEVALSTQSVPIPKKNIVSIDKHACFHESELSLCSTEDFDKSQADSRSCSPRQQSELLKETVKRRSFPLINNKRNKRINFLKGLPHQFCEVNKNGEVNSDSEKESVLSNSLDSSWSEYTVSINLTEIGEDCCVSDLLSNLSELDNSLGNITRRRRSKKKILQGHPVSESFLDKECLCCVIL